MYFALEPEVAGGLGKSTELDTSVHPPIVTHLEYMFEDWFGDDLVQTFPCFIVTERLHDALESASLSGYSFDDVTVSTSEEFEELYPDRVLPIFVWLKIHGQALKDDFWIGDFFTLCVSERALELLKRFNMEHCGIAERPG
jgi:hypothetical protein